MSEVKRNQILNIEKGLQHFPAVLILGVRQCGKSTVARQARPRWKYFDLENTKDYDFISSDIDFFFKQSPQEIIIDEAQELPVLFKNLRGIIDKVRDIHPEVKILLAGMMVPPNMGQAYAEEFQKLFPAIAKDKEVSFIPFLLKGVGGEADLNLPDGIHPTPEGHKLVTETVWEYLEPLL